MQRRTNARLAGFMFLFYIACSMAGAVLFASATRGEGTAAKLASVVYHAQSMRLAALLSLVTIVVAVVLAISLYSLTRDYDPDLAVLAVACRVAEGVVNAVPTIGTLALVSLATGKGTPVGIDAAALNAAGAMLLKLPGEQLVGATIFAVGSSIYSYLFLRAGTIPAALAWSGVAASVLLVLALPAQRAGIIAAPLSSIVWLPVLFFEVILGLWLLIKGVAAPAHRPTREV